MNFNLQRCDRAEVSKLESNCLDVMQFSKGKTSIFIENWRHQRHASLEFDWRKRKKTDVKQSNHVRSISDSNKKPKMRLNVCCNGERCYDEIQEKFRPTRDQRDLADAAMEYWMSRWGVSRGEDDDWTRPNLCRCCSNTHERADETQAGRWPFHEWHGPECSVWADQEAQTLQHRALSQPSSYPVLTLNLSRLRSCASNRGKEASWVRTKRLERHTHPVA